MIQIEEAKKLLKDADTVIVTIGNDFAKNEGFDLLGTQQFYLDFPEIADKYQVNSIGQALDLVFDSIDEKWRFWCKLIKKYSIDYQPTKTMDSLLSLLKDKDYFIATSTFCHFFENADFPSKRIFNIFGDWTKMYCSSGKNHGTFSNLKVVDDYLNNHGSIPKCEKCGLPMELAMPLNKHFFPDEDANTRFRWFLTRNEDSATVILELGVDETSPQLIDPMFSLVDQFANWQYLTNSKNRTNKLFDSSRFNYVEGTINEFISRLK